MTEVAVREQGSGLASPDLANRFRALSHGIKVAARQDVDITPTGLVIRADLTQDDYAALGRILGGLHDGAKSTWDALRWSIGDWLLFGEGKFGEEAAQIADAVGRSVHTMQNYTWVCSRVAPSRRRPELSWSHHEAVAGLEPRAQRRWLDKAVAETLGSDALRGLLRDERRQAEGDDQGSETDRAKEPPVVVDHVLDIGRRIVARAQSAGDGRYVVEAELIHQLRAALGVEA